MDTYTALKKSLQFISADAGLLSYIAKLPRMNNDPLLVSYGIWPCDSSLIGGLKYSGRSSGCGYTWENAVLSTMGEVVERYCPAFYDRQSFKKASYRELSQMTDIRITHPSQIALFHPDQFSEKNFPFREFNEDTVIHWTTVTDLVRGDEVWYPAALIYMPYEEMEEWVGLTTSTGLAAHTDLYKAILNGLYEVIERDSFVMNWMQKIFVEKIIIDDDIQKFLTEKFPGNNYEFHFFDISFDLPAPTVFGICFGKLDFGEFVAVGSAARGTFQEALHKVIMEIGQAIPYFRFMLGEQTDWEPKDFNELNDFEKHSTFYLKRTDLWHVFDTWKDATPTKKIDFLEPPKASALEEVKRISEELHKMNYDVLLKYLTTPDVEQVGFHSVKVIVPQLVELSGSYHFYFCGGDRLYTVPAKFGRPDSTTYQDLNRFPHPFP